MLRSCSGLLHIVVFISPPSFHSVQAFSDVLPVPRRSSPRLRQSAALQRGDVVAAPLPVSAAPSRVVVPGDVQTSTSHRCGYSASWPFSLLVHLSRCSAGLTLLVRTSAQSVRGSSLRRIVRRTCCDTYLFKGLMK